MLVLLVGAARVEPSTTDREAPILRKNAVKDYLIEMRADTIGPSILLTPRSHLTDRMTPQMEQVHLLSRTISGGKLRYALDTAVLRPATQRIRAKILSFGRNAPALKLDDTGVLIDLRRNEPQNWAHILTNHIPYVIALADAAGVNWSDLMLLLPENTPRYIRSAVEIFGLRTHLTDNAVQGKAISFEPSPWTGNRGARRDWAQMQKVIETLDASVFNSNSDKPLSKRIFISRRDSRRLVNEKQIISHLAKYNIETIYAEDFTPRDQFRLLARADLIIAIHGAALAPLLYRPPFVSPAVIVELLPVGHATLVWNTLAQQVGCRWIGVQSRIEPKHIKGGLYDLERPFLKFSTDDFYIDPASIDYALDLMSQN